MNVQASDMALFVKKEAKIVIFLNLCHDLIQRVIIFAPDFNPLEFEGVKK